MLLSDNLRSIAEMQNLRSKVDASRASLADAFGILMPDVGIVFDSWLGTSRFRIEVEGVPVEEALVDPQRLLLCDDLVNLELAGIPAQPDGDGKMYRADLDRCRAPESSLLAAGIGYQDCTDVVAARTREVLARNAARFIGIRKPGRC